MSDWQQRKRAKREWEEKREEEKRYFGSIKKTRGGRGGENGGREVREENRVWETDRQRKKDPKTKRKMLLFVRLGVEMS